ncbi:hypothetical protein N015_17365 [Pseudomonas asturiensis]|uniref:Uncharacterized protein n=1 Tax=Pseudomonas asturiensis TaxID=1190415 RepID=A0ABX6HET6_9PSED|nr:hypothetical protein [Pseudomonas asturiensis]QHF04080.1 hypothetical protein N015_17365 [Pseudomonas asturiensis]
MIVSRKISDPIRVNPTRYEQWEKSDKGLILCWETGRQLAKLNHDLAAQAIAGELPVLGWKGGSDRVLKKKSKFGSLRYLAQWQGLRGDDLHVDLSAELTLKCTKTGVSVTFTKDATKYQNQPVNNKESKESNHDRLSSGVSEESLFPSGKD